MKPDDRKSDSRNTSDSHSRYERPSSSHSPTMLVPDPARIAEIIASGYPPHWLDPYIMQQIAAQMPVGLPFPPPLLPPGAAPGLFVPPVLNPALLGAPPLLHCPPIFQSTSGSDLSSDTPICLVQSSSSHSSSFDSMAKPPSSHSRSTPDSRQRQKRYSGERYISPESAADLRISDHRHHRHVRSPSPDRRTPSDRSHSVEGGYNLDLRRMPVHNLEVPVGYRVGSPFETHVGGGGRMAVDRRLIGSLSAEERELGGMSDLRRGSDSPYSAPVPPAGEDQFVYHSESSRGFQIRSSSRYSGSAEFSRMDSNRTPSIPDISSESRMEMSRFPGISSDDINESMSDGRQSRDGSCLSGGIDADIAANIAANRSSTGISLPLRKRIAWMNEEQKPVEEFIHPGPAQPPSPGPPPCEVTHIAPSTLDLSSKPVDDQPKETQVKEVECTEIPFNLNRSSPKPDGTNSPTLDSPSSSQNFRSVWKKFAAKSTPATISSTSTTSGLAMSSSMYRGFSYGTIKPLFGGKPYHGAAGGGKPRGFFNRTAAASRPGNRGGLGKLDTGLVASTGLADGSTSPRVTRSQSRRKKKDSPKHSPSNDEPPAPVRKSGRKKTVNSKYDVEELEKATKIGKKKDSSQETSRTGSTSGSSVRGDGSDESQDKSMGIPSEKGIGDLEKPGDEESLEAKGKGKEKGKRKSRDRPDLEDENSNSQPKMTADMKPEDSHFIEIGVAKVLDVDKTGSVIQQSTDSNSSSAPEALIPTNEDSSSSHSIHSLPPKFRMGGRKIFNAESTASENKSEIFPAKSRSMDMEGVEDTLSSEAVTTGDTRGSDTLTAAMPDVSVRLCRTLPEKSSNLKIVISKADVTSLGRQSPSVHKASLSRPSSASSVREKIEQSENLPDNASVSSEVTAGKEAASGRASAEIVTEENKKFVVESNTATSAEDVGKKTASEEATNKEESSHGLNESKVFQASKTSTGHDESEVSKKSTVIVLKISGKGSDRHVATTETSTSGASSIMTAVHEGSAFRPKRLIAKPEKPKDSTAQKPKTDVVSSHVEKTADSKLKHDASQAAGIKPGDDLVKENKQSATIDKIKDDHSVVKVSENETSIKISTSTSSAADKSGISKSVDIKTTSSSESGSSSAENTSVIRKTSTSERPKSKKDLEDNAVKAPTDDVSKSQKKLDTDKVLDSVKRKDLEGDTRKDAHSDGQKESLPVSDVSKDASIKEIKEKILGIGKVIESAKLVVEEVVGKRSDAEKEEITPPTTKDTTDSLRVVSGEEKKEQISSPAERRGSDAKEDLDVEIPTLSEMNSKLAAKRRQVVGNFLSNVTDLSTRLDVSSDDTNSDLTEKEKILMAFEQQQEKSTTEVEKLTDKEIGKKKEVLQQDSGKKSDSSSLSQSKNRDVQRELSKKKEPEANKKKDVAQHEQSKKKDVYSESSKSKDVHQDLSKKKDDHQDSSKKKESHQETSRKKDTHEESKKKDEEQSKKKDSVHQDLSKKKEGNSTSDTKLKPELKSDEKKIQKTHDDKSKTEQTTAGVELSKDASKVDSDKSIEGEKSIKNDEAIRSFKKRLARSLGCSNDEQKVEKTDSKNTSLDKGSTKEQVKSESVPEKIAKLSSTITKSKSGSSTDVRVESATSKTSRKPEITDTTKDIKVMHTDEKTAEDTSSVVQPCRPLSIVLKKLVDPTESAEAGASLVAAESEDQKVEKDKKVTKDVDLSLNTDTTKASEGLVSPVHLKLTPGANIFIQKKGRKRKKDEEEGETILGTAEIVVLKKSKTTKESSKQEMSSERKKSKTPSLVTTDSENDVSQQNKELVAPPVKKIKDLPAERTSETAEPEVKKHRSHREKNKSKVSVEEESSVDGSTVKILQLDEEADGRRIRFKMKLPVPPPPPIQPQEEHAHQTIEPVKEKHHPVHEKEDIKATHSGGYDISKFLPIKVDTEKISPHARPEPLLAGAEVPQPKKKRPIYTSPGAENREASSTGVMKFRFVKVGQSWRTDNDRQVTDSTDESNDAIGLGAEPIGPIEPPIPAVGVQPVKIKPERRAKKINYAEDVAAEEEPTVGGKGRGKKTKVPGKVPGPRGRGAGAAGWLSESSSETQRRRKSSLTITSEESSPAPPVKTFTIDDLHNNLLRLGYRTLLMDGLDERYMETPGDPISYSPAYRSPLSLSDVEDEDCESVVSPTTTFIIRTELELLMERLALSPRARKSISVSDSKGDAKKISEQDKQKQVQPIRGPASTNTTRPQMPNTNRMSLNVMSSVSSPAKGRRDHWLGETMGYSGDAMASPVEPLLVEETSVSGWISVNSSEWELYSNDLLFDDFGSNTKEQLNDLNWGAGMGWVH